MSRVRDEFAADASDARRAQQQDHGMSETINAALAPTILKISGSFSPSALKSTV